MGVISRNGCHFQGFKERAVAQCVALLVGVRRETKLLILSPGFSSLIGSSVFVTLMDGNGKGRTDG